MTKCWNSLLMVQKDIARYLWLRFHPNSNTTIYSDVRLWVQGLGNNTSDYNALVSDLEARNVSATVVQVARADWLRNASGLLDGNYWKGTLSPRPVLNW